MEMVILTTVLILCFASTTINIVILLDALKRKGVEKADSDGDEGKNKYYFEIFPSKDKGKKSYRFRLKAPNHEIILASQGYTTKASAEATINTIKLRAYNARVEEVKN